MHLSDRGTRHLLRRVASNQSNQVNQSDAENQSRSDVVPWKSNETFRVTAEFFAKVLKQNADERKRTRNPGGEQPYDEISGTGRS